MRNTGILSSSAISDDVQPLLGFSMIGEIDYGNNSQSQYRFIKTANSWGSRYRSPTLRQVPSQPRYLVALVKDAWIS